MSPSYSFSNNSDKLAVVFDVHGSDFPGRIWSTRVSESNGVVRPSNFS